jgi:flagellar export protein FliJ
MRPEQLETVLRVRRHQRDQVRMAMARILAEGRTIHEQQRHAEQQRSEALLALRAGTSLGNIDIDRAAGLRYHAGRLSIELAGLSQAAETHAQHVKAAQTVLAKADQQVKAVEKLQERHRAVRRLAAERRDDREATDRFSATR